MLNQLNRQKGLSLVEAMLALVIAGAVIVMGIRAFQSYKRDADALAVLANVDMLAQAAAKYYAAECYGSTDSSTGTIVYGALNSATPDTSPTSPVKLNITTALVNRGYLTSSLRPSSLVDATASNASNGYIVQFRRSTEPRIVCTNADCTSSVNIGTVVSWKIEVGVAGNVTNSAMDTYVGMMRATCRSRLTGTNLRPCSTAGTNNNNIYWLFERMPSFSSSANPTDLWGTNPTINQFTQNYRNRTLLPNAANASQYFLCGS